MRMTFLNSNYFLNDSNFSATDISVKFPNDMFSSNQAKYEHNAAPSLIWAFLRPEKKILSIVLYQTDNDLNLPLISTEFLIAFMSGIGVGLEMRFDFGTMLTKL